MYLIQYLENGTRTPFIITTKIIVAYNLISDVPVDHYTVVTDRRLYSVTIFPTDGWIPPSE